MKSYKRVIGIDISTERLDIADSNSKITHEVDYAIDAIKSKILKLIKKPSETLVVCEATGGLEYTLVDVLHDAKIDVVVANPARIRGRGALVSTQQSLVAHGFARICVIVLRWYHSRVGS